VWPALPASHANSRFLDHLDKAGIIAKYKNDRSVAPYFASLPDVHYVMQAGKTILDIVGKDRFQVVLASHVVEHVPDLFGWLNDVASVLVPGGEIRLKVRQRFRGIFFFF
jgi:2-polyprenyl-3-methyl-5-hydroxy-6-metoxy-1,4-benzoquinol methylase